MQGEADDAGLDAEQRQLEQRHRGFGWWAVFVFALLGLLLEALHAFKAGYLLDVQNETRRSMWTLAHAHGVLLGLTNLAMAYTVVRVPRWSRRLRRLASASLIAATVMIPGGFWLGGLQTFAGDPGPGILLVPAGALLFLVAVFLLARSSPDRERRD